MEEEKSPEVETEKILVEETIEEIPDEKDPEPQEPESARETVARVLKEQKNSDGDVSEEESKTEVPQDVTKPRKVAKPAKEEASSDDDTPVEDVDPELLPPERLNAREKQMFSNLPKGLKRAMHRSIKSLESGQAKLRNSEMQQLQQERQRVKSIEDSVSPYVRSLTFDGRIPLSNAISELAVTHQALQNEETRVDKYLEIGDKLQIWGKLGIERPGGVGVSTESVTDITTHPEFQAMQQKLGTIESEREQIQSQKTKELETQIVQELKTLRDEIDPASGNYIYPEAHEEAFFQSVTPLARHIASTVPGIQSWGDAYKRAIHTMRGTTAVPSAPNPHAPQSTNNTQRVARAASSSVRGRTTPLASGSGKTFDPPPEALKDARASVEWAIQQRRRG